MSDFMNYIKISIAKKIHVIGNKQYLFKNVRVKILDLKNVAALKLTLNMLIPKDVTDEEYEEFATGIIDPQKFHEKFFVLLKCFQVLDAPIPKWT